MTATILSQTFSKTNRGKGYTYYRIDVILNSQNIAANTSNITINTYVCLVYASSGGYKFGSGQKASFRLYQGGSIVDGESTTPGTPNVGTITQGRYPRGSYTDYAYAMYAYTSLPTLTSDWICHTVTMDVVHDANGNYSSTVGFGFTPTSNTSGAVYDYQPSAFTEATKYSFSLPQIIKAPYVYNGSSWVRGSAVYVYTGTQWVQGTIYVYNGSSWVIGT